MKRLDLVPYSPSLQSEEAVKEWVQSVVVGGNSLIRSLEYSQVASLFFFISIIFYNISCPIDKDGIKVQLRSSLQETVTSVNFERKKKLLPSVDFYID